MLVVEGIQAGYRPARPILQEVTFALRPGQFAVLLGPNAAGKTTLLRVITGLLPAWRGRITWQGKDLLSLSARDRARLVAVVPQAKRLPPQFTVYQTVLLGRTPYLNWLGMVSTSDRKAVEKALALTQLADLAHRPMYTLSGGEQQRVLVARALAQEAPILLFDEPTTHLDIRYQLDILNLARRLAHEQKRVVLAVLHDLNQAALYADVGLLLHQGRIIASGPPQAILTPGQIQEVYGVQTEVVHSNGLFVIIPRRATTTAPIPRDDLVPS